jgi:hypothetical protein
MTTSEAGEQIMPGKAQDWRAGITAGQVVTEHTLHGDRDILAVTAPDAHGNYEGHIIRGADSGMPRERFSFSTANARVSRAATNDDREKAGLPAASRQVQIRVMGADGEWFTPGRNTDAILAALTAMRGDIEEMAGDYDDRDLRKILRELRELNAAVAARISEPAVISGPAGRVLDLPGVREAIAASESKPMHPNELGRYVCVMSCLHSPQVTIRADGVWVKHGAWYAASAHRDCYEAWKGQQ